MKVRGLRKRISFLVLILVMLAPVPALGASLVVGSVAVSTDATLDGRGVLPHTTVISGDSLRVNEGVAVVAIGGSSRMVFGRETTASFLRERGEVTVLLREGNVSLYHPDDSVALRVKAGQISVAPAKGFKTLGNIVMVNGAVVVTSKDGLLRVEGDGPPLELARGERITVLPKAATSSAGTPPGLNIPPGSGLSAGLAVGSLASGVVSSVLAGVAMSRAGTASANAAQADTDAKTAQATALAVGCALNKSVTGVASPFTPPPGSRCP